MGIMTSAVRPISAKDVCSLAKQVDILWVFDAGSACSHHFESASAKQPLVSYFGLRVDQFGGCSKRGAFWLRSEVPVKTGVDRPGPWMPSLGLGSATDLRGPRP